MSDEVGFQLGDKVHITAKGVLDGLRGRIYYLDENLLEIVSEDAPHRVEKIPIIDGDFDPSLEITGAYVVQKRASPAFVIQSDFQEGYLVETITEQETLGPTYTIKEISESEDSAVFVDETGAEKKIVFGFVGIPQDEDFVILRVRERAEEVKPSVPDDEERLPLPALEEGGPPEDAEDELTLLSDIEIPEIVQIREIAATKRFYPDVVQRNEMLQDLLSTLDIKQQKNPRKQSEIRKLVEQMMVLRNQISRYSKAGDPAGRVTPYVNTLVELLEKSPVPMSRMIADVRRVLYLDHSTEDILKLRLGQGGSDPTETIHTHVMIQYLQDAIAESNEYMKGIAGGSGQVNADILPNWFLGWQGYFDRYFLSWVGDASEARRSFFIDTEFIRAPLADVEGLEISGYDRKEVVDAGSVQTRPGPSQLRGLGPRYGRLKEKEGARVIEAAESVVPESYLLFPHRWDRELGAVRSGKIALDIGRSLMTPYTLEAILKAEGGVSDIPAAGVILQLDKSSLANISIEDWLRGQPIESKGFGDALTFLQSYGLASKELSLDQMDVVQEKITLYRALVRLTITELNTKAAADLSALTLQNNPMLDSAAIEECTAKLMNEPTFQKQILQFQARYPSYRENDLALFGFLFAKFYDFTLAVLSGNPRPLQIEIRRAARDEFLRRLYESMLLLKKQKEAGEVPVANPCPHVRSLNLIRKVKDSTSTMKLLTKFVAQFGGKKKDNWLICTVCDKQCLCNHELLLLQEFLHPREKETLHKELLLTFSGGSFHGRYLCKNCGQSISDVEFDTSLEYDDEGRPMMGRSVLVDRAAMEEDEIEKMLEAPVGTVEEIKFETEAQTEIYRVARQLMDRVGIQPTETGYKKIVTRTDRDVRKQPSRDAYLKYQKAEKAKGKVTIDYDIFYNRLMTSTAAAYCLIEIQTNVPGYVMRYKMPGCKAGFSGFPMGAEQELLGVDYFSCAIGSMSKNEAPWNLTGFQKEKSEPKRQATIAKFVFAACRAALAESDTQHDIAIKKEYLETVFGKTTEEEGLVEKIPQGFSPFQYKKGEHVVITEAAKGSEKIQGWIQEAHEIAGQTAALTEGSPFAETTCCFQPIQSPQFWKEKNLPELPKDKVVGPHGSHLNVKFTIRPSQPFRVTPAEDSLYRLFLKVCYQGPNKGRPHEFGYDHLCALCGLSVPDLEEGKGALMNQNIDLSRTAFQDLLDECHRKYKVIPPVVKNPMRGLELLEKLANIQPAPFDGWRAVLLQTVLEVQKLPEGKGLEDVDVAAAYGPISNLSEQSLQELTIRLGQENANIISRLCNQGPSSLVESLRTYFLIPIQRLLSGFHAKTLKVQASYKLGEGTNSDINTMLENHLLYMNDLKKRVKGVTHSKIDEMRMKLMALLPILQQDLRTPLFPGGAIGLPYLLRAAVLGIFASCADPNLIPEGSEGLAGDINARGAMQIISECLKRFDAEGLNFTPEQLRMSIARRNELEKMRIISRFDRMTEEEKSVELTNKRLGLGQWSIGGTSLIYAYNKDQYERERIERSEMGLAFGVELAAREAPEEDGVDMTQTAEDDF